MNKMGNYNETLSDLAGHYQGGSVEQVLYRIALNLGEIADQLAEMNHYAIADRLDAPCDSSDKPEAYVAVDFDLPYVLVQAHYQYPDGRRITSELRRVEIPMQTANE